MRYILILAALLFFQTCVAGSGSPASNTGTLAVEIDIIQNTMDGCTDCRCRLNGVLGPEQSWNGWLTIGLVRHDHADQGSPAGSQVYCHTESPEQFSEQFHQTIGIPYLVIGLSASLAAGKSTRTPNLELNIQHQQFVEFNESGDPVYKSSNKSRKLPVDHVARLTATLMSSNQAELEAYSLHEVILDLVATEINQGRPARFGSIAVTGDVAGAAVFLDGGFVGRLESTSPLVLNNVLAGKHKIHVRDFSNREVSRAIRVRKGKTIKFDASVLGIDPTDEHPPLVSVGNNPQGYSEYWRTRDDAFMVHVPPGKFLMGSPEGVGEKNERPQHSVSLQGFLVDKNEVTWRQYLKYVEDADAILPPAPVWGRLGNFPISFILYREAASYCEWVGGRLPTEAEWEKAARGTDGRAYPWGDRWDATRCNTISGGMHRPEPIGNQPECISPYGILDMAGSVKEWTTGAYQDYPYDVTTSRKNNETLARSYIMKGGGWMSQPQIVRSAYRHKRSPTSRLMDHGFRCVLDFEGAAP